MSIQIYHQMINKTTIASESQSESNNCCAHGIQDDRNSCKYLLAKVNFKYLGGDRLENTLDRFGMKNRHV